VLVSIIMINVILLSMNIIILLLSLINKTLYYNNDKNKIISDVSIKKIILVVLILLT